jgi:VIT1/CCC1 family predicted Fe2+/Mn2+ transporter
LELERNVELEKEELAAIYINRGLDSELAVQVADQLMAHDAISAHARDELGISEILAARPVQAAFSSAGTFALGAAMPLLSVLIFPASILIPGVSLTSLLCLTLLGIFSAKIAGSSVLKAASRVTFWGALAMGITAGVGALFGIAV